MTESVEGGNFGGESLPVDSNVTDNSSVEQKSVEPVVKKYKVKVNNEDLEVDEAELLKGYQTARAANEKFQESAQMRKQAEEFISLLQKDPMKILNNPALGIDMRKLAEEYLVEQFEYERLTPEQKELKAARKQLAEIEAAKKAKEDADKAAELEHLTATYSQNIQADIIAALDGTPDLPKTPYVVGRIAYYMAQGLKRGKQLSARDVAPLVKEDYINETKNLYGNLDVDTLVRILGDDVTKKIKKHGLEKLKTESRVSKENQPKPSSVKKEDKPKMTKDEYFKALRSKHGN